MKNQHLLCFLILLGLFSCKTSSNINSESTSFIVLQMNDVYEIAPLEGGKAGGLARVATVRQELLKENPNVITVLSGDFLSPSFIGTLKGDDGDKIAGLQMIETLNALGLDYTTYGNHEFDIKDPDLLQKRIEASQFLWTGCNVLRVKDGKSAPFVQHGRAIPPYIVHEVTTASGEKIKVGLIGVVLPFNKIDYVEYLPVEETFRNTIKEMKDHTDIILGMTHLAIDGDLALGATTPEVPLFMGGHDHVNMDRMAGKTRITKADANAKTVYIHRVTYNSKTGKASIRSTLNKIDDTIADEPKTKAVVDKWFTSINEILDNMGYEADKVVMTTKETLECKEVDVRSRQTNFGNLTVSAFKAIWPEADLYLVNSGSMRLDDDIQGVLTQYDVLRTYPFGGGITQQMLNGKQVQELLRAALVKNIGEGGYCQVLNVNGSSGNWSLNGQTIDPAKKYKVVLPKFMAKGFEANLEFLGKIEQEERVQFETSSGIVKNDIRDIVIHYMEKL